VGTPANAEDEVLEVLGGISVTYPFSPSVTPHIWNGTVYFGGCE
jgi:hypothetical protein